MYTTQQLDNGILNNYARDPQTYYAVFPSPEQRRNYAVQGAIATLLVTTLILIAFSVS